MKRKSLCVAISPLRARGWWKYTYSEKIDSTHLSIDAHRSPTCRRCPDKKEKHTHIYNEILTSINFHVKLFRRYGRNILWCSAHVGELQKVSFWYYNLSAEILITLTKSFSSFNCRLNEAHSKCPNDKKQRLHAYSRCESTFISNTDDFTFLLLHFLNLQSGSDSSDGHKVNWG